MCGMTHHPSYLPKLLSHFIALRASAAVTPLICALDADLGAMGAGDRAVVCGAMGNAAGAQPR